MYDVAQYKTRYEWTIKPVGQLVKFDSRVKNNPTTERFCSGFNINNEGLFLTAGHCLAQGSTCGTLAHGFVTQNYAVEFNYQKGEGHQYRYPIKAVLDSGSCVTEWTSNESIDYATLQLDRGASQQFGYIKPVLNYPTVGADVIAVSHPNGDPKKISFGKVQAVSDHLIDHTARIEPGSSGSPLTGVLAGEKVGLGVNVSVSTSSNVFSTGSYVDHKHHYALPINSIAQTSHVVKKSSYKYSQNQAMFKQQRMDEDSISVTEAATEHERYQSNNNGCCM